MKFFYVHPNDARWLRRWLVSNVVCFAAIIGFLLMIRIETATPINGTTLAQVDPSLDRLSVSAVPSGWRRTDRGWEDVSRWRRAPRPLGEIIATQQSREPKWIRTLLAQLRAVPPLAFALIQISLIAAIVRVGKTRSVPSADA